MKKVMIAILLVAAMGWKVQAQSFEVQQLILDFTKLIQLKQLLSDMKTGYEVVSKGYSTIRDISQGNFSLHKTFLDGLLAVSPAVQHYQKVAGIISFQLKIVSEYKAAFNRVRQSHYFNPDELTYIGNVYGNLVNRSLKNIDDLITVITANRLRMSDNERLEAIDKIYADMQDKLVFLRYFNNNNMVLALQKAKEQNDVNSIGRAYGIKP